MSFAKNLPILNIFILLIFLSIFSNEVFAQQKTVGLTKHLSGGMEDGYVLFTPLGSDTTFLINKCGQKVHTWYSQYTPGLSVYLLANGHLLKTGTYSDTTFGGAGGRGGVIEELDWDGKVVWSYVIFTDSLCQHHDIHPMPNGNVMVMTWHSISKTSAMALGRNAVNFGNGQNDLWGERLIELKPRGKDSADIVWQWNLFDHIVQDQDSTKPNFGNVSLNPGLLNINYALNLKTHDWIHMNGIDYNPSLDQIVMSCHNISEIWVIDHGTSKAQAKSHSGGKYGKGGDFLYRWGNPQAYNQGTPQDRKLFRQHNATWIPGGFKDSGSIILFNNGWERDTAYSSIDIISTPIYPNGSYNTTLPFGPSKQSWIYKDSIPTRFYSQIISGTQRLPNGNTLICSGVQGRFFEINANKKTVWEYKNPSNGADRQKDGDAPNNNSVFRCVFYPNTYAAFKNKNLTSYGTIEKNSYIYSCTYETNPPKIKTLVPAKNDVSVNLVNPLKIIFDEAVIAKSGKIEIYQNNALFQTILIPSVNVKIHNDSVTIQHQSFNINSRIAVKIFAQGFRDSSDNLSKVQDSSLWYFSTSVSQPKITTYIPVTLSKNVAVNFSPQLEFSENIKAGSGQITIWENSLFKEKFSVTDSNVGISGNIITIHPSSNFAYNATIVIELDACLINENGIAINPVVFGDWYFKTISLPTAIKLTPANNAKNILVNSSLSIDFDRNISLGKKGSLLVFENNVFKDSIELNGPRTTITGSNITFDIDSDFGHNKRISVWLKPDLITDSMNTAFNGIDSSAWHFITEPKNSSFQTTFQSKPNSLNVYPNPNKGCFTVTFSNGIEQMQIFDLNGKSIWNMDTGLGRLNMEAELINARPGLYLVLVNGLYSQLITVE